MNRHGAVLQRVARTAPRDSEWVPRFGATERFLHWWTVLMVSIALGTGLALGDDEAQSGPLLIAHWGAVALGPVSKSVMVDAV